MTSHHVRDIGVILQEVEHELASLREQLSTNADDPALHSLDAVLSRAQADLASKAELVLQAATQQPTVLPLVPHRAGPPLSHRRPQSASARRPATATRRPRTLPPLTAPLPLDDRKLQARPPRSGPSSSRRPPRKRPSSARPRPTTGRARLRDGPPRADNSQVLGALKPVAQSKLHLHDPAEKHVRRPVLLDALGFNRFALRLDLETQAGPKYVPPPSAKPSSMRTPADNIVLAESAAAEAASSASRGSARQAPLQVASVLQGLDEAGNGDPEWARDPSNAAANEIRKFAELMDEYSLHQVLIRNGRILTTTPEFASFERSFAHEWGGIRALLLRLEALCARFCVKLAIIDGKGVAELAMVSKAGIDIDNERLLETIVNAEDVLDLFKLPGRRFAGANGVAAAATAIQAAFRMWRTRRQYVLFKAFLTSVVRIQRVWRSRLEHMHTRERIAKARADREAAYEVIQTQFSVDWPHIRSSPRTVVHLPSLALARDARDALPIDLETAQNSQMARVLDLMEDGVNVIYVAPFSIPDDLRDYYVQMLELRGVRGIAKRLKFVVPEAVDKLPSWVPLSLALRSSPKALRRIRNFIAGRAAYIVPSAACDDDMHLAVTLGIPLLGATPALRAKYGTKSGAQRLFHSTGLTAAPCRGDLYTPAQVEDALTELIAAFVHVRQWLFKTNHGMGGRGHALFCTDTLPCYPLLLAERAKYGDGWFAEFHQVTVRKRVRAELREALEATIQVMAPAVYMRGSSTTSPWHAYLAAFCSADAGGLIEAVPERMLASPSISILIEPDGKTRLLAAHDQILTGSYAVAGGVYPQTSVVADQLVQVAEVIGSAAFQLSVMGHVKVDFVVFDAAAQEAAAAGARPAETPGKRDGSSRASSAASAISAVGGSSIGGAPQQVGIWAIDLSLGYSDALCVVSMARAMTAGYLSTTTGKFMVRTKRPDKKRVIKSARTVVWLDHLVHPELATMNYAVLFGVCRELGVAWSPSEMAGLVLVLKDSWTKGLMGLISVGNSVGDALGILHMAVRQLFAHLMTEASGGRGRTGEGNFGVILGLLKSLAV
ncbi:iqch protein [Thecamonas trahens ATCC 50062]|uniref:Iqch protein n=1 Tax=Thecamonas trahens ATCC 50062 TaxID=461836 RepID=A0A0L0D1U4_THETB|nr:iqch protein [Thecamonas trahens ATCC 50062]KNC46075.1 iqch protein [Thecamonas trahens ATCC 50062]|eukprot:XP_013763055.1 iqch protein [Thecamonas trahens ATCC 50062]